MILLLGCTVSDQIDEQTDGVAPVEEEQIKNVVEDFYVRQPGLIPEYEAKIEEIENNWARVSIRPAGVDTPDGADLLFLQNQAEADRDLSTPTIVITEPQTARVSTDAGWVIVAGPQAQFTQEELSAAGVPAFIRP